jgi:hypothetical protein
VRNCDAHISIVNKTLLGCLVFACRREFEFLELLEKSFDIKVSSSKSHLFIAPFVANVDSSGSIGA